MGGREWRAVMVFVLVSLVGGAAVRGCRGDAEPTLTEQLRTVEEESRLEAETAAANPRTPDPVAGVRKQPARRAAPPALGTLDPERATAADWERLPGIGPSLAARIVADRAANGPFGGVAGLARVRGIGPKTVERLRPFLTSQPVDSMPPIAN